MARGEGGDEKWAQFERLADDIKDVTAEDFDAIFGDPPHLIVDRDTPNHSIEEQLRIRLASGIETADAVGSLKLSPEMHGYPEEAVTRPLSSPEEVRLYLYQQLTEWPDYRTADLLDYDRFRAQLNLTTDVSENTVSKIIDALDEKYGERALPELYAVARTLDGTDVADDVLDPPVIESDGTGPPLVVELSRDMRKMGYGAIQLQRDESRTTYDKWELFKPFEVAANTNTHLNDAPNALRSKPHYYSRTPPTERNVWNQLRIDEKGQKRARMSVRAMFLCAYEQYYEILREHGYIPEHPDIAVDLTDWPWFGKFDDEDTPYEEREQPDGVEGTKPGRNYSYSFQLATISFANVKIPMTFGLRAVSYRKNRHWHLGHLLRYAESICEPGMVFLDKDFYTIKVKDELKKHDLDFVIGADRSMDRFDDLISGTFNRTESWNSCPWEIGVDAKADEDQKDHYLFVNPSKKRLKMSSTGLSHHSNWEAYYSNVNPEEFDGGGAAMAERYRLRWAIETAYRQLKEEFLPKSGSSLQEKREFLAQLAITYNNAWMCANVLAAERRGVPVKDDQGRYLFTANEFMTAMTDDFAPIDIGELADLSKRSKIVKYGMRRER